MMSVTKNDHRLGGDVLSCGFARWIEMFGEMGASGHHRNRTGFQDRWHGREDS